MRNLDLSAGQTYLGMLTILLAAATTMTKCLPRDFCCLPRESPNWWLVQLWNLGSNSDDVCRITFLGIYRRDELLLIARK